MEITLFGLTNCDTCRKARKALPGVQFRDVRADPLSATERHALLLAFGDKLINRASTTWRGLSEAEREESPESLLAAHPALMKRPVIAVDGGFHLGWTPDVRAALGVA